MTKLPQINTKGIKTLKDALILIQELVQINRQLFEENQQLRQEIARLKKQPKTPKFKPASDYSPSKKLNQLFPKKNRWQKGYKKDKLEIDQQYKLPEVEVCGCGCKQFKIVRSREKIVQDIMIQRNNIRYYGNDKQCLICGKVHLLTIPEEVKNQEFGSQLRTWVSQFKYDCRFSEKLIHQFLTSLGIKISLGQISNIILTNSHKLIPAYSHLRVWGIKLSPYLHTDATGAKRRLLKSAQVINQHLHFIGHSLVSVFKITRRYNSDQMAEQVLKKQGMKKAVVSDDHSANGRRLPIKAKQLCWLHEIRHYLKLTPLFTQQRKKLEQIIDSWWQLYHLAKGYGRDPTPWYRLLLVERFYQLVNQRTGYQALDHRLSLTRCKSKRLLTFLDYPYLPIENNLAERDLRPAVIIRKLSGMTKSVAGDRSLERHLSTIQTARKQGLNVYQTLHGLLNNQISPFVLTAKVPAQTL